MTNQKPNPKTNQTTQRPALQATPIALASLLCLASLAVSSPSALAQAALERQGAAPDVATIVVTESRSARAENLTGFGDVPLREIPQSVVVLTSKDIADKGLLRLSDLTKLDPSTTESYNAVGYWDFLEVRGVLLDNLYNYRREGLPISAETSIPLDNKESVEILKGTSGMQAGQSTAGGLVNYTVKRPTNKDVRTVRFEMTPRGGTLGGLDVGGRFGEDKSMGYRFNAVHETLRPALYSAEGRRDLLSLAMDKRVSSNTLLEGEIEVSKRTQPSQAAFSVLAHPTLAKNYVLPDPVDPKINLNNQPWSQPVVMGATTATVKLTQVLSDNWTLTGQLGMQQLRTDDREAFPGGCGSVYPTSYFPSFCSDGTFNINNYDSAGEKRQLNSGKLALNGKVQLAGLEHNVAVEHLRTHTVGKFNMNAYNLQTSGVGNLAGTGATIADPTLTYPGVNRNDRASEWMFSDSVAYGKLRGFAGLRVSQIKRTSRAIDDTASSAYSQSLTTPWAGASYALGTTQLYAGAGQGVELPVVPSLSAFYGADAGHVLPVQKSHQFEVGARGGNKLTNWSVAWFDITKPTVTDTGSAYFLDGIAKHRGIEAQIQHTMGPLKLAASTMLMKAIRSESSDNTINGQKPTNVPANTLRLQSNYKIEGTGWDVQNVWVRDGARAVTPTNDVMLPAWSRWDLAIGYQDSVMGKTAKYRIGIDNVTDKRYWKGSPTQFGNYFLYPGAPRTIRFSAALDF